MKLLHTGGREGVNNNSSNSSNDRIHGNAMDALVARNMSVVDWVPVFVSVGYRVRLEKDIASLMLP
jgi:hypothetical protein